MKTNTKDILSNIIKIRLEKNFTQSYMADCINVDHTSYSKLETGKVQLTFERLEKIASFFNMEIIDIITYPEKYVPVDTCKKEVMKRPSVTVQIDVDGPKKDEILSIIFGKENAKLIFNP